MNDSLPGLLKAKIHALRPVLERCAISLQEYSPHETRTEKVSYGVYLEKAHKGVYLTAWTSGEMQVAAIDYSIDASPRDVYLPDVDGDRLGVEIQVLLDWMYDTD